MSQPLWYMTATETARRIANKEISAVDVIDSHLTRLDDINPKINAITRPLHKQAREAAFKADVAVKNNHVLGPLHGVPITIKDNVDVIDQTSPNGVIAFQSLMAGANSPVVDNLLKAGAIPIGRTNTPEFSLRWHTNNPLFGNTINPWNRNLTPGGSSGGASASLAVGIGCIGHGNDLGGSLRYPAFCTGLATIRPTQGRIPAFNPTAAEERPLLMQLMSTQGPIARSIADVRLGLDAMAKGDIRDPFWVPAPMPNTPSGRSLKVALIKNVPGTPIAPEVLIAIQKAGDILGEAGYQVEEIEPPELSRCLEVWAGLITSETRSVMGSAMRKFGSEDIVRSLNYFESFTPKYGLEEYIRLASERTRLIRLWSLFLENFPLIVGPVSNIPPFAPNEDVGTKDEASKIFHAQGLLVSINLLGLPAVAVSTGLHDGQPLGVQIIASRFCESLCLDAAQSIEESVGPLTPINPHWI